ncbi:MAG: tripartite tricarboxylate transporter substrate binding protein [Reyranella sp.]|nr:tripartite tricarboxylate transporter substrate binding protein [Reyranella sp.]
MKRLMGSALAWALAGILAALPASAQTSTQTWPDKPVHVIVPFTAGSATDVVARAVAQAMSKNLGQVFVVENKPGAGGTIGASQVAKSAPDGYTLLVNSSAHTVNPSIYQGLPFDTAKDLPAVSMLAQQPNIMVAAPSRGWKTAADFVKAAKQQPDKLNYASAGTGSGTHMNAEKFKLSAGIDAVHVPYRGTPEALTDTMNGRVDIFFAPIIAALPMIRDNRVVALGNGGTKRASVLPDLATTEEQGFKNSGYNFWVGMFAPAGTPPALIEKLNAEVKKALDSPEVKDRLGQLGADASPTSAADFDKIVVLELKDNAEVVNKAGIKVQ